MPDNKTEKFVTARITPEVYKQIEAKIGLLIPQRDTTDIQAGYMLGVQHVLKIIREDIVVELP